jgi:hypothetical protein
MGICELIILVFPDSGDVVGVQGYVEAAAYAVATDYVVVAGYVAVVVVAYAAEVHYVVVAAVDYVVVAAGVAVAVVACAAVVGYVAARVAEDVVAADYYVVEYCNAAVGDYYAAVWPPDLTLAQVVAEYATVHVLPGFDQMRAFRYVPVMHEWFPAGS